LLKSDLQQIYEKEKQNQQDLYHECMPLLKGLLKTVKDSRNKQKDEYHLMERYAFCDDCRMLVEIGETKKVLV